MKCQKAEAKKLQRQKETQTLCMVSPPCRLVKDIKGWLDCTGQLQCCKAVSPCQTHRCRVMSHCVLEFCQKASCLSALFCSISLLLTFPHFLLLFSPCVVSHSVDTLIRLEFSFNECLPCMHLFTFESQ